MNRNQLVAAAMAAILVLTVFASVPVAAAEAVVVETLAPSKVTTDKAELQGNLTELDNASEATVWFEYWPENDSANATVTENETVDDVGTFTIEARGLASNTTYVAVAHAATGNASAVGGEVTFTTEPEPPLAVSTEAPTNVTATNATFNGELTRLEGDGPATVWFEYWPQGDRADAAATANQTLDATGPFDARVTGLEPGTEYVVQVHGAVDNETVAGGVERFETDTGPQPLGVETRAATDVTNDSATLNGELTGLGSADNATVWFEWWERGDSANASETGEQTLEQPGSFSEGISGLDNDTTYVYVAHASANGTTVSGDRVEFTAGAADDGATWDGEGPFGQWVSRLVQKLMGQDPDGPLGRLVSELVTENNPGPEHRSDKANPGGNRTGPPEHANASDDGNETERGPPEDAGPPEHANGSDDGNETERGPPEDAGAPGADDEDDGNETERGPPEDAGPPDNVNRSGGGNETERGPPEDKDERADKDPDDRKHTPPDEDESGADDAESEGQEDDENEKEKDEGDEEEDDGTGGPPDDAGPPDGNNGRGP